jgi:hypothetical protein
VSAVSHLSRTRVWQRISDAEAVASRGVASSTAIVFHPHVDTPPVADPSLALNALLFTTSGRPCRPLGATSPLSPCPSLAIVSIGSCALIHQFRHSFILSFRLAAACGSTSVHSLRSRRQEACLLIHRYPCKRPVNRSTSFRSRTLRLWPDANSAFSICTVFFDFGRAPVDLPPLRSSPAAISTTPAWAGCFIYSFASSFSSRDKRNKTCAWDGHASNNIRQPWTCTTWDFVF